MNALNRGESFIFTAFNGVLTKENPDRGRNISPTECLQHPIPLRNLSLLLYIFVNLMQIQLTLKNKFGEFS